MKTGMGTTLIACHHQRLARPRYRLCVRCQKLSRIIQEFVIEKLDHKNLNMDVDFMQGKLCSIENLVMGIWQQLEPNLPEGVVLHSLKMYETPRIYVEYYGNPEAKRRHRPENISIPNRTQQFCSSFVIYAHEPESIGIS